MNHAIKVAAILAALIAPDIACAQSTINPNVPAQGAPLSSSVVRNNFAAAFNDINGLFSAIGAFNATAPITYNAGTHTIACPTCVAGPNTTVVGHLVSYANTTGNVLADTSSITGSYTFSGNLTLNPASGIALTVTPLAASINQALVITQTSQTTGTVAGPLNYNYAAITHRVDVSGSGLTNGVPNQYTAGFRIDMFTGGGSITNDNAFAGIFTASQVTSGGTTSAIRGLLGFAYTTKANTGMHGTDGVALVDIGGNSTQYGGMEASAGICDGIGTDAWCASTGVAGTAGRRYAISLIGIGRTTATITDTAIIVANNGTAGAAWNKLISLSNYGGSNPLSTTADLFYAEQAYTIANVFNLSNVAVTGNILGFQNAALSGGGRMSLGTNTAPGGTTILQATCTSCGQNVINASANTTSGADGLSSTTSDANNSIAVFASEPARTTTVAGITVGNWASITTGGANNNGLLIVNNLGVPVVVGTNNLERARLLLGLMVGTQIDPGVGGLGLPALGQIVWNNDTFITRRSAAIVQLGQADVAGSPVAQALAVQNATGVLNTAGANAIIAGSRGTGSGVGGNIAIQTAPATGSGSSTNPLVTALTIFNTGGVAVGSAATDPGAGKINVATSATVPLIIGGTGAASNLTLESTSGVGTTDSITFQTGSQVNRGSVASGGNWTFGATPGTPGFVQITKNTSTNQGAGTTNDMLLITQADGVQNLTEWVATGAAAGNVFAGSVAGNTLASPAAVASGKLLMDLRGFGYTGSSWFQSTAIIMLTAETYSGTAGGGQIQFKTTPLTTQAIAIAMTILPSGCLAVGTTNDCLAGGVIANKVLQTVPTVVGSLPTCNAAAKGARSFVTDATATTFHNTVAGGGANNVGVTCDGTNWFISANDNIPEELRRKFA